MAWILFLMEDGDGGWGMGGGVTSLVWPERIAESLNIVFVRITQEKKEGGGVAVV